MSLTVSTDRTVLDLLRRHQRMTVADFQRELGVTATAVRQRLNRLLASGYISREKAAAASGRGRPSHSYVLTTDGRRQTGANFADLASVLWEEIRAIKDHDVRRGLLARLSQRLANLYRPQVAGSTLVERMQAAAGIFEDRQLPFQAEQPPGELPVLKAFACPYPELAEKDRSICALERMMLSDLVGQRLTLDQCRLDGDQCCSFQAKSEQAKPEQGKSEESRGRNSDGGIGQADRGGENGENVGHRDIRQGDGGLKAVSQEAMGQAGEGSLAQSHRTTGHSVTGASTSGRSGRGASNVGGSTVGSSSPRQTRL